jgi:LuxR family transcriptional regulator, maltose regulon positive regulatory protein
MSQLAVAGGIGRTSRAFPTPALSLVQGAAPGEGIVWRTALVNRLRAAHSSSLAAIIAPTGYGKTTVLEQWAARDGRRFVRLRPDPRFDDPAALLAEIDALLDLRGNRSEPVVVVIDDAHLLSERGCAAVGNLVRLAGAGAMVVLSGRIEPRLPNLSVPRLRARGELLEVGPRELALTRREILTVLRAAGRTLTEAHVSDLVEETEGWPAAVQLAARGCDYRSLESRCLAELTPAQRVFLRRTSVLDRLTSPLCDAALASAPGRCELESIDELGTFLVPIDRGRGWFRYHPLLRGRLLRDLEATEPELVATLHARAADWYQQDGDAESAMEHTRAAGDIGRFMEIFAGTALPAHNRGLDAAVQGWLRQVDAVEDLDRFPGAAALAARLHAHHGRAPEATRCLDAADRPFARTKSRRRRRPTVEESTLRARIGLVHVATEAKRPAAMLAGAESALEQLPASDPWRPYGLLLQGVANALLGEGTRADAILARATEAAERLRATETWMLALAERALLAEARGDYAGAEAFLAAARTASDDPDTFPSQALMLAASARILLRQARSEEARSTLVAAQRLLPGLTDALPWLAVQTRLELAAAYVMLRDEPAARFLLAAVDELLASRPSLGTLDGRRSQLAAEVAAMPTDTAGHRGRLTGAELRLLPLLATHLSFREIGAHFYLSRHTVKTQAISAYRKLGASSRSEAVLQAEKLGLIETSADGSHVLIPSG